MKLLLDALQAHNRSGTGTYVTKLLQLLPTFSECPVRTAIVRTGNRPTGWDVVEIATTPRIAGIYRRHVELGQIIDRLRPDLVHFPASFASLGPIRCVHRPAVVSTLHDTSFLRNPNWFPRHRRLLYRALARATVRQSDLIVTDSEAAAVDIRDDLGVPDSKLVVVPLGCDPNGCEASETEKADIRARYRLPASYFLFLGTIEPRKNVPRIIRAWDRIAEECPCNLVIAGREGWKTREYRRVLKRVRHRDRIHVTGFVAEPDLATLTSGAVAMVWPSLYEGFGLPPLDAMACGVPVLTSNTSSLPEVVDDAAVLVNPLDEDEIAAGMLRLHNDATLRETLVERGRERAQRLSWERTVSLTIDAYRKAIERHR